MTAQTLSAQIELCFRLPAHSRAGLESLLSAIRLAAGSAAGAVCGSRTGAAGGMPRVGASVPEAWFPRSGERMDPDGCPLVMGDGPGVSRSVGALANRRYRKMPTNGDGARGIHALFGSDRPGG